MRTRRLGWAVFRAAVTLAALYAFVLQGVLAGAVLPLASDPAHVLCAPKAGGDAPGHAPAHLHLPCCTAVHLPDAADPPPLPAPLAPPRPRAVALVFRPEVAAVPRAPPGARFRARAPPVV